MTFPCWMLNCLQTYNGVGRTKKRAKQLAAEAALRSFIQLPHLQPVQRYAADDAERRRRGGILAIEDFTNDDMNDVQLAVNISHINTSSLLRFPPEWYGRFQSKSRRRSPRVDSGPRKYVAETCDVSMRHRWWNPVAVLSDLRPNIQYSREAGNDSDGRPANNETARCRPATVSITAVVDGQRFHGHGRTLRQAKRCLAADVLRTVFHFRFIGQKPPGSSTSPK